MSPSKPAGASKAKAKSKPAAKPAAVETLRIIPAAPAPTAGPDIKLSKQDEARSDKAKALAADIEAALRDGEGQPALSPEATQALIAALCKVYSNHIEAGLQYGAFSERSPVTPTDVMVTASGLLKAANLAVFELGMWQSWTGR